tara:strand:+ start:41 stop:451 length:411 start_codon:yes stop_codon:yes gene_type:complete
MKLLSDDNILKGIGNAYNYPDAVIARRMEKIIYELELLDINIETDGSVAMEWDNIERIGEQGIIDSLNKISKNLVGLDRSISDHHDDYHWWRFNAFMVALNDYLKLGVTISERPYETERLRSNSAYDMGKFLFNNQ